MTFFQYFVVAAVLFSRFGDKADVASWVESVGLAAVFLACFLQFWRDPTCFDYFRYSFRETQLAMNHYFIIIPTLLISTLILSIPTNYSWLSLIPISLLLIYTIAYKPYKDHK